MATIPEGAVFPHPTVKQVIFQIKFPKLFFLETKLGDLQLALIDRFPKSSSLVQRSVVWAQGPEERIHEMLRDHPERDMEKIWVFEDERGVKIEIKLNSLTIVSERHKAYRHDEGGFRETIETAVGAFRHHVRIPIVERVGFRYVNECPFPELSNESFRKYFSSCLPIDRFGVAECSELACRVVHRLADASIRYVESILQKDGRNYLTIDMDASAEHVAATEILETADRLHGVVRDTYQGSIKDPVIHYMATGELQ